MKWGRFLSFLLIVCVIIGLTAGTSFQLWRGVRLGLDLQGGFDLLYKIESTPSTGPVTQKGVQAVLQAVQMRVDSLGVSSPIIDLEKAGGQNEVRVQLAGQFNQQNAENVIGKTAQLRIYGPKPKVVSGKTVPGQYVVDKSNLLLTGKDLKSDAHYSQNQLGQNVIDLTFKNKKKWAQVTKKYLNKPVYTYLNGKLLTSATIDSIISNGQTQLSGPTSGPDAFTPQYCQTLSKELNAGALPYPLKLISSNSVGPSLGFASLKATMWAGLAAIIIIFLFMIVFYRMAGLIADLALVAYGYLTLGTFSGMHVVLTLSGLAALVLGIGMAVDANIITYERIKDEVRNGRSIQSAVIAGNRRAMRAIIDANATTFIAGGVMYWFGHGDIRGFAIALMISIVISMLTAVLLSRAMLLLFTKSNIVKRPWWYGVRKGGAKS
ncbi:protein translocase subunit SecD [Alicyclobacillus sp. SO9]|uniref:protein translocase subunit SecD n=1 Tax=Alicyclobacillus sp. SO9 TaxID=2665646 RepID=UPI0018E71CE8|nr:protein translocase subunit SecD [Alicyclobacillus sp. SO9]QQE77453.1 protein translocase subunit SecD [Alicyclobacillus sp. SO9]